MTERLSDALKQLEDEYKTCPVSPEMLDHNEPIDDVKALDIAKSLLRIAKKQDKVITEQQALIAAIAKSNISLGRILTGNILIKPQTP